MATFKEALTTSLTNFAKSIAKTYPKTANIVDNLLSTDSTLPLSAKQGNVLQTQIDTLNSNSITGINVNHEYVNAGYSSGGVAYKFGNTVIIHAFLACATFISGVPLFFVPEGYRPSTVATGQIKCKRLSKDEIYTEIRAVQVDANGNVYQEFNSDGTGSDWQGEIFICYSVS